MRNTRAQQWMWVVTMGVIASPMWAQTTDAGAAPKVVNSQAQTAQPGQVQPSASQAQAPPENSPAAQAVEDQTQSTIAHPGILLDRVVAVVNGQVILESDVDEERRLAAFQPISEPGEEQSRSKAVERLINRELLLQQAKLQPQKQITDEDVDKQIAELRKVIPACKAYKCETEEGWQRFLTDHGVTAEELKTYWRERLEALQFVEVRFRTGIRITPTQVKSYYDSTMLPEYARRHVTAPKLEAVSARIEEVLLEQQVSGLLADWLQSLRAQGTVQVVADGASAS